MRNVNDNLHDTVFSSYKLTILEYTAATYIRRKFIVCPILNLATLGEKAAV